MAETISNLNPLVVAILGGVIPSLIWLWFWLREDRTSPEPKGLIALSFFAGMAIVYFVLPIQQLIATINPNTGDLVVNPSIVSTVNTIAFKLSLLVPSEQTLGVTFLAFVEEFAKYATVFLIAFRTKYFDEPLDAVVYLITAALGFAAMENILYILKDLAHGGGPQALLNGNMRFVGATIAHTISSAIVGIAVAFSFFAPRTIKLLAVVVGILLATLLHAYFNLSIMESNGTLNTLLVFSQYWVGIVGIIILLQIVKRLKTN